MIRENGYYWVRLPNADWEILFYDGSVWENQEGFTDNKIEEINETRLLSPDEQGLWGAASPIGVNNTQTFVFKHSDIEAFDKKIDECFEEMRSDAHSNITIDVFSGIRTEYNDGEKIRLLVDRVITIKKLPKSKESENS